MATICVGCVVWIFEVLYGLCTVLLSLYGLNSLLLTLVYLWQRWKNSSTARRGSDKSRRETAARTDGQWPSVTVQLPVYNELHTVERLLDAVAALDYPRDRFEIQVLDDSTDDTRALVARLVSRLRNQGIDAVHITRADRTGYKAGALRTGLASAKGDLLAVFDADFCPRPDFLRRVVPHLDDPGVGCVQARWGHVNRTYSPFTRVQALIIDGHFRVEQSARSQAGLPINFNGTAGVWRRASIEDVGGWSGDTLTEDLDLSFRAQLNGWRIVYLPDVVVPAELPVQMGAFKRQQARWAQGSIQVALQAIGPLFRSRRSWVVKLLGLVHLTSYLSHLLIVLSVLLLAPLAMLRGVTTPRYMAALHGWVYRLAQAVAPWLTVAALGPPLLYAVAQVADGRGWPRRLLALPLLVLTGIGIALSNAWAVLKALLGLSQGFLRTPKYAVRRTEDAWVDTAYALDVDSLIWGELAMAAYALALVAFRWVSAGLVPWLLLYAAGFTYVAATGLIQALRRRRWLARAVAKPGMETSA